VRASLLLGSVGISILLASCDPAILFFEEDSNTTIRLLAPNVAQVSYWERDGVAATGEAIVLGVAGVLFPKAILGRVQRPDDHFVVYVAGAWAAAKTSTFVVDAVGVYDHVRSLGGRERQGIGICIPVGADFTLKSDKEPFDRDAGCAAWDMRSVADAPTVEVRTRPDLPGAFTFLGLCLGGLAAVLAGLGIWRRRGSANRGVVLLVGVAPVVALVLLLPFGGDFQAFSLAGYPSVLPSTAQASLALLILAAVAGPIAAARGRHRRLHPLPPHPDFPSSTPPW
jgi:hypothetical protein